jgi:hypothetical protein
VSGWTGEALRRAAIAALGPLGDARARDALVHGVVVLRPGVARWQASHGPVEGVGVVLRLDGPRLERALPHAVEDALRAALAAAVATRPGESLFDFAIALGEGDLAETPYRGRRPRA